MLGHLTVVKQPEKYRHRWEMPMVWLSALLTGGAFGLGLFQLATQGTKVLSADEGTFEFGSLVLALLGLLVFICIARFYMAAGARANAIKAGPRQFPELYARYIEIARAMDMPKPPALYVANGNGEVNAFALECNRRMLYVVVNAEIAHMVRRSPGMVDFVLAHELAHHKLRHVSLWRGFINIVPSMLVLPGKTATRAQEYSADRLALRVCPDSCHAMNLLAVGPTMATDVDAQTWLEQCDEEETAFMVRINNALSDHAVLTKRFKALKDIENHGFDTHGAMF